jgi:hypothetical protein
MPTRIALIATCVAAVLSLTACGGGGADVRSEISTTTKGQQLLDLQKAFEAGALSQQEYDRERKKLLSN